MRLRERIARWLWPEGVRDSAELFRLRGDITDLWWWGVSNEVALTSAWLRNRSHYRTMTQEQFEAENSARLWPQHPLRSEIGDFRSWMHAATPEISERYVRAERERMSGKSPHQPQQKEG